MADDFEKQTDDAASELLNGNVRWFWHFASEEIHFARFAQQVILAKAFRRLSDGMQGQGQEGRTRQEADALND
jgi:hypothetical protein